MCDTDSVEPVFYAVVVADPPWTFRTYSDKGKGRSPERHYESMSFEEIRAVGRSLSPLLAPDCALFLWVPDPHLNHGIRVGEDWGLKFKTVGFTWTKLTRNGKPHLGCGYYTRANPEQCLLFTRGRLQRVARNVPQWIQAPVGRHSEKPEAFYQRTEALFGEVPRLELFGRRLRPGWTVLGWEIDGLDVHTALARLSRGS
jgi:N6-adenosine-specific RNA methylase IME4